MPFRPTFDCLWCGTAWRATGRSDLTGWASLCPDCLERAQDNPFLRYRLRAALRERSGGVATAVAPLPAATSQAPAPPSPAASPPPPAPPSPAASPPPPAPPSPAASPPPPAASPPPRTAPGPARETDDDWYLRRGRYDRGQARDLSWHMELDQATTWLDVLPIEGVIVELAAGGGWWSPLLAGKGELSVYDADPESLERVRERLLAHRLRAHIHVRDPWAEPDRQVDGLFCARWLDTLDADRLAAFLALARRWLRPGGRLAFIDALPDAASGPVDDPQPARAGRTPQELREALDAAGFLDVEVATTPRFFVMGTALAPG